VYTEIWGGLEHNTTETEVVNTNFFTALLAEPTCDADVSQINWKDVRPTRTEDWSSFIKTYTKGGPEDDNSTPLPLPPSMIEFLKLDKDMQIIFSGSDLATCTVHSTTRVDGFPTTYPSAPWVSMSLPPPEATRTIPVTVPISLNPPTTVVTGTYLSTTYESTSTHITRQGCLRCDTTPIYIPPPTLPTNPAEPSVNDKPESHKDNLPIQTPDMPGIISSILNDLKSNQDKPKPTDPNRNENPPKPTDPGRTITIGDSVIQIHPAQPTLPNDPKEQETPKSQNPGVVIGSETLTAGQTTTINGVEIVFPTDGRGSSLVVGGTTIAVNSAPTGPLVLTVGDSTVTANTQGQFVVGTQTLTPEGPAITVDGSTLSLGPSGTIAIVNGITQTLGTAPFETGAPVLTINGQTISATVVGGSTQFVLGTDQTLTEGGVLTVDGTTFSMPVDGSGSTIVVNGVTSTLDAPGLPILTLKYEMITASVAGGTTAFVIGPGQTLIPGGVIIISGTTYSMPASASGSVIVINGVTSTLVQAPITTAAALTIDGKTYSATIRNGTTEYVLGPGTTLKPGEAITVSGTTYLLDNKGTALVINGKTSSMSKVPASNSATTTRSGTKSQSTSGGSSSSTSVSESLTTSERAPGNFIASGIGITNTGGAIVARGEGLDKWVEGVVMGMAGWVLLLL
jgi:hypothetical protein